MNIEINREEAEIIFSALVTKTLNKWVVLSNVDKELYYKIKPIFSPMWVYENKLAMTYMENMLNELEA